MIALSFPHLLRAALLLAATGADPALVPLAPERTDGAAVRVLIETMVIDRRGTWSAGADQADLIPGSAGILKKSITLEAKDGRRTKEPIEVVARLIPGVLAPGGPACALALDIETRAASAAPGKTVGRVTSTLSLAAGEERFVDAYVSPKSGNKVAFRVRCVEPRHEEDGSPEMVAVDLEIERRVEGESPSVIGDQKLVALLGREVAATVSDHTTLSGDGEGDGDEGARFRRERLDVTLSPIVTVAGKLQIEVRVSGEVATVGASGKALAHPIDRTEVFLVSSLEARSFEIVLPGSAAEGWTDLRFLVQIRPRF
ncbi:MAG TPA: hypothetical protein VFD06_01045 [Candidatus Polarisedimenticolia bacterium]|nr:hypothetical protein [Candidatus Polarisedimenticolia bacterium]